jgi:hypothetical protein
VVWFLAGQELKRSTPGLGLAQHSVEWALGTLSVGVNWTGYEGDPSLPCGAKVKNEGTCTSAPPKCFYGMHGGNLTL